jgi:hypothetical protein
MTDWFRSWHGAPTDTKWLVIARRACTSPVIVSAVAWALMDHASQADERGDVSGFDIEGYATWAEIEESVVENVLDAMTTKGMIVDGRLAAWERRQPKREDDSTMRVRAFRDRSNAMQRSVTHRNNTEADTEKSREEQQQAAAIAPTREVPPPIAKSTYETTLNGSLPALESLFQHVDKQFNPVWLAKELASAEAQVGPLSREQLGQGLDLAVKQLKRQMDAGKVNSPRPFAHRLIVDYLTEQRDSHHAA